MLHTCYNQHNHNHVNHNQCCSSFKGWFLTWDHESNSRRSMNPCCCFPMWWRQCFKSEVVNAGVTFCQSCHMKITGGVRIRAPYSVSVLWLPSQILRITIRDVDFVPVAFSDAIRSRVVRAGKDHWEPLQSTDTLRGVSHPVRGLTPNPWDKRGSWEKRFYQAETCVSKLFSIVPFCCIISTWLHKYSCKKYNEGLVTQSVHQS